MSEKVVLSEHWTRKTWQNQIVLVANQIWLDGKIGSLGQRNLPSAAKVAFGVAIGRDSYPWYPFAAFVPFFPYPPKWDMVGWKNENRMQTNHESIWTNMNKHSVTMCDTKSRFLAWHCSHFLQLNQAGAPCEGTMQDRSRDLHLGFREGRTEPVVARADQHTWNAGISMDFSISKLTRHKNRIGGKRWTTMNILRHTMTSRQCDKGLLQGLGCRRASVLGADTQPWWRNTLLSALKLSMELQLELPKISALARYADIMLRSMWTRLKLKQDSTLFTCACQRLEHRQILGGCEVVVTKCHLSMPQNVVPRCALKIRLKQNGPCRCSRLPISLSIDAWFTIAVVKTGRIPCFEGTVPDPLEESYRCIAKTYQDSAISTKNDY